MLLEVGRGGIALLREKVGNRVVVHGGYLEVKPGDDQCRYRELFRWKLHRWANKVGTEIYSSDDTVHYWRRQLGITIETQPSLRCSKSILAPFVGAYAGQSNMWADSTDGMRNGAVCKISPSPALESPSSGYRVDGMSCLKLPYICIKC